MSRSFWQIENVDAQTRRKVKAYAALNGMTLAEALKQIVGLAKI